MKEYRTPEIEVVMIHTEAIAESTGGTTGQRSDVQEPI